MSIVQLKKVSLYGCSEEKLQVLEDLQLMGCLHITPLNVQENILDKREVDRSSKAREALNYLTTSPLKLKQIVNATSFDPALVEKQVLQNKRKMAELQDESDAVKQKIKQLAPWGHFILPDAKELGNQRLWFYVIPHQEIKKIEGGCAETVNKDNLFSYVVAVGENEPSFMPGDPMKLPDEPLNHLKKRLDEIEFELEDLQMGRAALTRQLSLFETNLFKLEDKATLTEAAEQTYDTNPVFALQAWAPSEDLERLKDYAKRKSLAVKIEEPAPEEIPPTLLNNKTPFRGGEDLLTFYMTPSYWLWDPSTTVFFSFAIFFAMIFSDAGYSIILGAIVAFYWKRMGKTATGRRFRNVLLALTLFSLVWGILVGSYFGIPPSEQGYLTSLKIIDMKDYSFMMLFAIAVGVIHILIANIAQAWSKRRSLTAIANIGWAIALVGAVFTFIGFHNSEMLHSAKTVGFSLMGIGVVAILSFTSLEKPVWKRFLAGLIGLTRVSGMFGDILSYLRLFALGLASASLAEVFNDLAKQVYHSVPGFKIIFALLIILVGHGMNFFLSIMSGFIHGLRLNFIEFFNWGLPDEGIPFKAFSKKETSTWNQ